MLCWSNTSAGTPGGGGEYTASNAVMTGTNQYCFPWVASARIGVDYATPSLPTHSIAESQRTSSLCYMRGLKENMLITTSSGQPWRWRRICFTFKGDDLWENDQANYHWSLFTATQGMVRVLNNIVPLANAYNTLNDVLFEGTVGEDWASVFNAKVDTQRINIKSDTTRTIASGNANGVLRNYKKWYPMNKNLQFDDDDSGGGYSTGRYSTRNEGTMGDYYVIDYFVAGLGATDNDRLAFNAEATLYWHEK